MQGLHVCALQLLPVQLLPDPHSCAAPLCPAAQSVSATLALGGCMRRRLRMRPVTRIICMQVDKHKSDVSREVNEIHRRSEQEKTQRTCMMR